MPWLTPDEHTRRVEEARDIALRRLDRCAAPRAVLARTLERRGIDPHVAKEALDRLEAAAALALARRKLAATRGLDPDVRRRRALALLGRKGYSATAAADAVDAAWAEAEGA